MWFTKDDKVTNTEKLVCMLMYSNRNYIIVAPHTNRCMTWFRELLCHHPMSCALIGCNLLLPLLPVTTLFTQQDLNSRYLACLISFGHQQDICELSVCISEQFTHSNQAPFCKRRTNASLPLIWGFCQRSPKTVGEWKIRAKIV